MAFRCGIKGFEMWPCSRLRWLLAEDQRDGNSEEQGLDNGGEEDRPDAAVLVK